MSSIPDVQSLANALHVLQLLNEHGTLRPIEIHRHLNLSRGAVYRLLKTLSDHGYLENINGTGSYCATTKLLSLGYGYDDETWVQDAALPIMRRLSERVEWPVALGVIEGPYVHVRATTDDWSQFVLRPIRPGYRVPIFQAVAGWVILAFQDRRHRLGLIRAVELAVTAIGDQMPDPCQRDQRLTVIRKRGYDCLEDKRVRQNVIAVPIALNGKVQAALVIRIYAASENLEQSVKRYLPILRVAADDIAKAHGRWLAASSA